jgi:hypothetical protein
MQLALLGLDEETLALVRWAVEREDATLVAAYDIPPSMEPQVRRLSSLARVNDTAWESLLLEGSVDVVIVSRGRQDGLQSDGMAADELRADQLRKLIPAGLPLLMVHPACDLLLAYELDMLRLEGNRRVLVHQSGVDHPAFARLQQIASGEDESVGVAEYVTLEHKLSTRDRGKVLNAFSQDMPLLRRLLGSVHKLTASGPITEAMVDPLGPKRRDLPSLANLLINLQGAAPYAARWSVGPSSGREEARLTIVGSNGRATLVMTDVEQIWQWEVEGTHTENERFNRDAEWQAVWQRIRESLVSNVAPSEWGNVCRDLEVVSVIDRSVQKGRTVELLAEERGEGESFKGVMAVGGCLTLLAVLGVILLAATVEGLHLPIRNWPAWRLWPVFVLLPVLAFLLLQTLQVFVRPKARRADEAVDD